MKRTPFFIVMSVWANPSLSCWFIRFSLPRIAALSSVPRSFEMRYLWD